MFSSFLGLAHVFGDFINVVQLMLIFSNVLLGYSSSLGKSEWLLSVPVVSSGGDSKTSVWMDKWIRSLSQLESVGVSFDNSEILWLVFRGNWHESGLSKLKSVGVSLDNSKVLWFVLWSQWHELVASLSQLKSVGVSFDNSKILWLVLWGNWHEAGLSELKFVSVSLNNSEILWLVLWG